MDTPHWSKTERGQKFTDSAFKAAQLPEVTPDQLEPGTYTNEQVAEMCATPQVLLALLMQLPEGGGNASRRSILSFAVDFL